MSRSTPHLQVKVEGFAYLRALAAHSLVLASLAGKIDKYTVASVSASYAQQLAEIVILAMQQGTSSGSTRQQIISLLRGGIAQQVYTEGMKEGGSENPIADLTDDDFATISTWVAGQVTHVGGYADRIFEVSQMPDTLDDGSVNQQRLDAVRQVSTRLGWWVANLTALGALGRNNQDEKQLTRFNLGSTKEHCSTCLTLSRGRDHLFKWFRDNKLLPQQPGNKNFECGCFRCQCFLTNVKTGERVWP